MSKEQILNSESLEKVVGGSRPQMLVRDDDQRWEQYKFDQNLAFENKKLDAEMKKVWIENGFKLASDIVEKGAEVASEAAKAAAGAAKKAATGGIA